MGEVNNTYNILNGEPGVEESTLETRWDIIKRNPRDTGCGDINGIHLAQGTGQWRVLVNTVMNVRVT
jgi:hypothetical protein